MSKAHGPYSHAEGHSTKTIADYSHAEGKDTITQETASHAEGLGTKTNAQYQHVEGKYNQPNTKFQHIVGGGSSDSDRKNIQTLDWYGNEWLAGNLSAADFITSGGIKLSDLKSITANGLSITGLLTTNDGL